MRTDVKRARWLMAGAVLAYVVIFSIGGYLLWDDRPRFRLWVDLFWTVAGPLAAIRAAVTARRQSVQLLRWAWYSFACGAAFYTLGMLVWDLYDLAAPVSREFPTVADFFFLLVSPCYILGFFIFRPATPSFRVTVRQLYYLGILICSAGMVNTLVFAAPMGESGFNLFRTSTAILFPALAVSALVFGLISLWIEDRPPSPALRALVVGAGIDFLARTTYPFQLLSANKIPTYLTGPLWLGLLACTFWAAWEDGQQAESGPSAPTGLRLGERPLSLELTIPALAMFAVVLAGWLLRNNLNAALWPYLSVQAVVLVGLTWGLESWNRGHLTDLLHQVRHSEGRVRSLLDSTAEGIFGVDGGNRIVFANPAAVQMLGFLSPREMIGHNPHTLFHHSFPDGKPYPIEECPLLRPSSDGSVNAGRDFFWNREGQTFPIEYQATPLIRDGLADGSVIVFTDVSARLASEQALARSEAHFRSIVQHAGDAIIVLDSGLMVQFASPSIERIFGHVPDTLKDRMALELIHPEDHATVTTFVAKGHFGSAATAVVRIRRSDGSWAVAEIVGSSIEIDGIAGGFVCHMRDITERLAAETARLRLEDQFRQSQKMEAVGLLAGGIAHDFNNLLTAILGTAALLREQIPAGTPMHLEAREIETAAERGASLTRQLLTFSRRETAQPRAVDLHALLIQMTHLLRRLLGEEVRLATALDPAGAWVLADPGHLEQVVMNLAVNARDAMPNGGVLLISTSHAGAHGASGADAPVILSIEDNGVGMSPEVQAHAFEPFFTTKEVGRGSGLGLATVYGIVQQAGGAIEMESTPDVGTIVRVRLRAARREDVPERPVQRIDRQGGQETILLVEDETPVRIVARRTLAASGYTVLEAADAVEARRLAALHAGAVKLLITDVIMPGVRGPALAAELSVMVPELRVLYISGYSPDDVVRREDLPGYGFMQKPFTPAALRNKVRELLNGPSGSPRPPIDSSSSLER